MVQCAHTDLFHIGAWLKFQHATHSVSTGTRSHLRGSARLAAAAPGDTTGIGGGGLATAATGHATGVGVGTERSEDSGFAGAAPRCDSDSSSASTSSTSAAPSISSASSCTATRRKRCFSSKPRQMGVQTIFLGLKAFRKMAFHSVLPCHAR